MTRERGISIKEAAAEIMAEAYAKVSGNGILPANARQIMYAARPQIQEVTGQELNRVLFHANSVTNFMTENNVDWDVIYDARGHFNEPHGGRRFGLGTLEVRRYLEGFHDPSLIDADFNRATVKTSGPSGNFDAVLFIEKEGFSEFLKASKIAKRFDIAFMCTKGI